MIITRTPLRISFVGGGSDLPSYFLQNGGAVISTTIDRYIYINVHKSFNGNVRIAYSQVEEVSQFSKVQHPLVKNSAEMFDIDRGLEITSIADIPARGSGLGSSSSFSVGLIHALSILKKADISRSELAEKACKLEIELCGQPIGKQDQYAASFGGFNVFEFKTDNTVDVKPVDLSVENLTSLMHNLMIFYTGSTRNASHILSEQNAELKKDQKMKMLEEMVALVKPFRESLVNGDIINCGRLLHQNWLLKKQLASSISSHFIDEIYNAAMNAGAVGGKLLGAGGSGFMLFVVPPGSQAKVSHELRNLERQYWNFETLGSTVIHNS